MFFVPIKRDEMIGFLPKGGTVAEIGVAEGHFSDVILKKLQPKTLHLVDPWVHQPSASYDPDPNNVGQMEQDARHGGVTRRFLMETLKGQVVVHRTYGHAFAAGLPDRSLNLIYLDGMHTYEAVHADLTVLAPKIAPGGFFMCNDFTNHLAARDMNFGVVEAIRDFTRAHGWSVVAMTNGDFPDCVLARESDVETIGNFTGALILLVPNVVQIRDPWQFKHLYYKFPEQGEGRLVPSF